MAPTQSIIDIAGAVQAHTAAIHDALSSGGLPEPTFENGGPPLLLLPPSAEGNRTALLQALDDLRALIMGPVPYTLLSLAAWSAFPGLLDVIYKFQIPQLLKLEERVSYAELGKRCGLTESATRHIIRAAISIRYFQEPEENIVMHNAFSQALVTVPGVLDWVGFCTDDVSPAAAKWAESLQRFPGCEDTTQAAFAIANAGQEGYFAVLDKDLKRQKRFANGQGILMAHPARDPVHFVNSVDWSGDQCPKTVVDIGGSNGPLLEAILRKYPGIQKGVVQDLPGVVSQATVPEGLEDRMSFESYDFFTPQKRKADVRIFRVILHDWPDADVIRILRNQIPVLEPGNLIILNDSIEAPNNQESLLEGQQLRISDVMMHQLFNAKERSKEEWVALFAAADERFKVKSFISPPSAVLSTIIVEWVA